MIDTDEAGNIKQKSVEHQWVLRIKKRVTLIKCLKKGIILPSIFDLAFFLMGK